MQMNTVQFKFTHDLITNREPPAVTSSTALFMLMNAF